MQPATTSAQALTNLQTAQAGQQSPDSLMQSTGNALGIPAAQQQVSGLRGAINNTTQLLSQVAPSVMGRTQNSLVTSAQANQQIANGQAPLNTQLNQEQTDYTGANSDLTNLTNQQGTEVGNDMTNQQNQLSYLQGIYGDLSASEQQKITNAQAEESLANSRAAASSSLGGLAGGSTSTPTAPATSAAAPTSFAKGTTPQNAVAQLFKGYQVGTDQGYTESAVIPALEQLLALNNPTESKDVIHSAAQNIAYTYRKQNFNE